jgi:hypothetical protein
MGYMTETPEHPNEPTNPAAASRATEPPSRWDRPQHRPGGIYRLAAFIVFLVGIVLIVAVIFWSGFILGAHAGGHHRGDSEGGRSSHHEIGMMHSGLQNAGALPGFIVA